MTEQAQADAKVPSPPESTLAYQRQARRLVQLLDSLAYTGDADRDFAALLAPLHTGLSGLAAAELAHGQDPGLREIAARLTEAAAAAERGLAAWTQARKRSAT